MDSWKPLIHKLQIARRLAWRDWLVLGAAWWMLWGFRLALHWMSFDRLENFTHLSDEKISASPDPLAWARRRQRLVSLAGRLHLPPMTCLPRALTLRRMLSRHAIPSQLRIGMNKAPTGMLAQAWVEVDGEAVGEPEDIAEDYKVLHGPE